MNPAHLFRQDSDTLALAPGEALFRANEVGREMFVLIDGSVDILVEGTVVEQAGPGALLGEMALIEQAPRAATVVAQTPCRLARINERRFHFLIQQNPFFASHVMKVLADRLRKMNQRMKRPESPA